MCLEILCCCFGPLACGLCCGFGSKTKSSIVTRILYMLFLVFAVVVSSIMLSSTVRSWLESADILCSDLEISTPNAPDTPVTDTPDTPNVVVGGVLNCEQFVGYLAVYRVCMAVASFFLLLMLIMLCVFSSKDPRSYIQNGFWFFKWLLVIGLVIAFFFIPEGDNLVFGTVSLVFGLAGSIIFIVIQVILLVDFAHSWAESWVSRAEESENNLWYIALLIPTVIFYVISLIVIILLYVFFTELSSCSLNKFFITSTLILGVVISVIAILPWVQKVQPKSGLLQASVVTLYAVYLTWSALSTEPYGERTSFNITTGNTSVVGFYDCRVKNTESGIFSEGNGSGLAASIIGIIVLFITTGYMCYHLSGHRQLKKFRGDSKEDESLLGGGKRESVYIEEGKEEDGGEEPEDKGKWHMSHVDDEKESVTYSYSFFHFLMLLAVLYLMMQLTNWANPGSVDTEHFQNSWASTWVKMSTVWFCFGIYIWTLVAPLVLGHWRDFGYED